MPPSIVPLLLLILNTCSSYYFHHTTNAYKTTSFSYLKLSSNEIPFTRNDDDSNQVISLKSQLFAICATCDRGFGATEKDKSKVSEIVSTLKVLCKEKNPTKGLFPNTNEVGDETSGVNNDVPIEGVWKLAYTTAFDVVSLAGNPITQLQGIYQVISRNGSSANVIDFAPRFQTLLPSFVADKVASTTRAVVYTSAYARSPTRVGLTFKKIGLKQESLLGQNLNTVLPFKLPSFQINLPDVSLFGANSESSYNEKVNSPGYFDVLYLDEDCLIIQQNEPGGIFVNVRDISDEWSVGSVLAASNS